MCSQQFCGQTTSRGSCPSSSSGVCGVSVHGCCAQHMCKRVTSSVLITCRLYIAAATPAKHGNVKGELAQQPTCCESGKLNRRRAPSKVSLLLHSAVAIHGRNEPQVGWTDNVSARPATYNPECLPFVTNLCPAHMLWHEQRPGTSHITSPMMSDTYHVSTMDKFVQRELH